MAVETNQIVMDSEMTRDEARERIDRIDFKMVTFSLGGKDYGIDIMKVKEIAKFASFTYVPNSMPYVRGVYNLRGEIISIIDLRIMFHLPTEKKRGDAIEEGLILRLSDNILGVIVDNIDKVVGISSGEIKPPHPIFGDINIKYISGVVEYEERLYIILDVEKIFGKEEAQEKEAAPEAITQTLIETYEHARTSDEPDRDFIAQTLATFKNFTVSDMNIEWLNRRYDEWKEERKKLGTDLQLKSPEEAEEFLEKFYSPFTNAFWNEAYASEFEAVLPQPTGRLIQVWNAGCGNGYETYSLTAVILNKFPGFSAKVWANDSDLLSISTAPNLIIRDQFVPEYLKAYTVKGKNGLSFHSLIKDAIYFEYHDIINNNQFPDLDLIVARDLISFMKVSEQHRLLEEFHDRLKPDGVLVLGRYEKPLNLSGWEDISQGSVSAFKKKFE
jgi:purine-binding chemotaxis protein CheW